MPRLASSLTLLALAAAPAQAQAQWSTDTLTVSRSWMGAVTVGDLAIFAGGRLGPIVSYGRVDIYNNASGTWSTAQLSVPRGALAATVVGHLALFAGGSTNGVLFDRVDVYDSSIGLPSNPAAWSIGHPLSQARSFLAATTVGTKAIFAGGDYGSGTASDRVDIYDASIGPPSDPAAWSTHNLTTARFYLAAATVGSQALFAGGTDFSVGFDTVDRYDDSTGSWDTTGPLWQGRSLGNMASATVGTRAYFAGGESSTGVSDVLDIYDSLTGSWTKTTLSRPRVFVSAQALGNTLIFAGGFGTTFLPSQVTDILNTGTDLWDSTHQLSLPLGGADAITVGGRIMFAGGVGVTGGGATDAIHVYEPLGVSYCAANPNSTGGASTISASGSSSLVANHLVLTAVSVPSAPFLFFHGSTQIQLPFGNGFRCTGGGVVRIGPSGLASGGVATRAVDLPAASITSVGVRNFQCWYRNPAAGGAGFNTSDAIAVTFVP